MGDRTQAEERLVGIPGWHWHRANLYLRPGTLPVVVLILVLAGYWAVGTYGPKPPPKPDETWTRILQDGVFRVGIDPSFPPFEMDDGKGNLSGLDVALADEMVGNWSRESGTPIRIQYVYTGFDGLYDALKTGQYDAILSALPYDPKKTEDVRFSYSYFNGGPLVVVREADASVKSWYDLADRRVGVELGSSGDGFARKWERRLKYELHEFSTPADALHALQVGQVDGVFTDSIAFEDYARAGGAGGTFGPGGAPGADRTTAGLKTVGNPLTDELFVMAVRKDTPTLLDHINAVVDAMKKDGRMEKLQAEWF